MIATVVDGDGGETRASQVRLQTSSKTCRFHPRSSLSPISGSGHPHHPFWLVQFFIECPQVGYVVGSRKGDGIGFERLNRVFRWGEVGEREVAGEERQAER